MTRNIRRPFAGPLAAVAAVTALAACGGGASDASQPPVAAGPAIVVETPPPPGATPARAAATPASATPRAASSSTTRPAPTTVPTGAAPAGSADANPRARPPGASPGTYAVHLHQRSTLSGQPYDGPGSLTVATAAADGTQAQTVTPSGRTGGSTMTYRYLSGGEVDVISIGGGGGSGGCDSLQAAFTPPLEVVPARPATGATWSGRFSGGGVSGTYTGTVTGQATDTVGGAQVPVWKLHGSVDLGGTVCGFPAHAVISLDSDWAPSLSLPVLTTQTTDATVTALHATITSTVQLTSPTPS